MFNLCETLLISPIRTLSFFQSLSDWLSSLLVFSCSISQSCDRATGCGG